MPLVPSSSSSSSACRRQAEEDVQLEDEEEEDAGDGEAATAGPLEDTVTIAASKAAAELLQAAHLRIECAKVCAPAQLADLVDDAHGVIARVSRLKGPAGLKKMLPVAQAERATLTVKWQQRSGMIRTVVRIRPPAPVEEEAAADSSHSNALHVIPGNIRSRGLSVAISRAGRSEETHAFKRFDYILGAEMNQDTVFRELKGMLPNPGPGGLGGPPQSACLLAYGQTGSGKTFTMHGGSSAQSQGLVPRVLVDVFDMAAASGAEVSVSALEVYNDVAYDLLDGDRPAGPASNMAAAPSGAEGRAFQAGRRPPPPGLSFKHGRASAMEQATTVSVPTLADAHAVLEYAADRRSTRSTIFNATSSRSHSLVFVYAQLPGTPEPQVKMAFVDLAGSERLPASQATGAVAEESRHINLSLSSLGSVIHALRHRSNHLPYRACLLTRLLEPFFGSHGRVLLCVCVAPEQKHAQETLCSLAFADRASRAVLGADTAAEVERGQVLAAVREAHASLRLTLRTLLPALQIDTASKQPLPDWAAAEVLQYIPEAGPAAFVCREWARLCPCRAWWGRRLRTNKPAAEAVLQWLDSKMEAALVCRLWWRVSSAVRVTMSATTANVLEACAKSNGALWKCASAKVRTDMWKALMVAGGGSGAPGSGPLAGIRECVITGAPKPEALKQVLVRCSELRVAEIPDPDLVQASCSGLSQCTALRALKCSLKPLPLLSSLRQVLHHCRSLRVLSLSGTSELLLSLGILAAELPKACSLRELTVTRCWAEWQDVDTLARCCKRLRTLRLPKSFVSQGDSPLSPPPLVPLAALKMLQSVDFEACSGRGQQSRDVKQRPWLTDDMFALIEHLKVVKEVRATGQKLLSERCFWLLRRHAGRLAVLHLNGCQPMAGDLAFSFLHRCVNLTSLRLPAMIVGQSQRKLDMGTNRWCQGLLCLKLRELAVDAWTTLEDLGVQMITSSCPQLSKLWLRQAPRLSDDATAYIVALPKLASLALSGAAGLTDRTLSELSASAGGLQHLDMAGCRQITDGAVAGLASKATDRWLPLRSAIFDLCPSVGRAAAEALVVLPSLQACSLNSCRALPLAATCWTTLEGHKDACTSLGVEMPQQAYSDELPGRSDLGIGLEAPQGLAQPAACDGNTLCAICLDTIGLDDAYWECPVCCNRLHDIEDCAQGWLRLKQSCPTCRAAVWAPPEQHDSLQQVQPSRFGGIYPRSRARPPRASTVDATPREVRTPPLFEPLVHSFSSPFRVSGASMPLVGHGPRHGSSSYPVASPSPVSAGPQLPLPRSESPISALQVSGRPPRPSAASTSLATPTTSLRMSTTSSQRGGGAARARSVPPAKRAPALASQSLALVGSSIVGVTA
mmetsp:Transcript_44740/g.103479  ORF Transcript_44740/g.103479 Transcript_44740/m.103479 type:complete len:1365 (-) Transcript_44740:41-4135(-)